MCIAFAGLVETIFKTARQGVTLSSSMTSIHHPVLLNRWVVDYGLKYAKRELHENLQSCSGALFVFPSAWGC
jgi:hypothetical protein